MREQARTLEVATYTEGHEFDLTGMGEAVRLAGSHVSAEMFSALGSRAQLGRTFLPKEDLPGNDNLVILSNQLWEQRFGRDPGIVGRSIQLEGINRQVVGVMPAEFRFPSAKTLLWIPLHVDPREDATSWRGDYMPSDRTLAPGLHAAAGVGGDSAISIARGSAVSLADAGSLERRYRRSAAKE